MAVPVGHHLSPNRNPNLPELHFAILTCTQSLVRSSRYQLLCAFICLELHSPKREVEFSHHYVDILA